MQCARHVLFVRQSALSVDCLRVDATKSGFTIGPDDRSRRRLGLVCLLAVPGTSRCRIRRVTGQCTKTAEAAVRTAVSLRDPAQGCYGYELAFSFVCSAMKGWLKYKPRKQTVPVRPADYLVHHVAITMGTVLATISIRTSEIRHIYTKWLLTMQSPQGRLSSGS